jgi:hypothetical protein
MGRRARRAQRPGCRRRRRSPSRWLVVGLRGAEWGLTDWVHRHQLSVEVLQQPKQPMEHVLISTSSGQAGMPPVDVRGLEVAKIRRAELHSVFRARSLRMYGLARWFPHCLGMSLEPLLYVSRVCRASCHRISPRCDQQARDDSACSTLAGAPDPGASVVDDAHQSRSRSEEE